MENRRFMKKIKSRGGASISFALLLFLVCAVIGSLVLTAASAAGGRFKNLRESDRRSVSIHSAAELLSDLIGGKSVTIVRTQTTTKTTDTTYTVVSVGQDGKPNLTASVPEVETDTVYGLTVNGQQYVENASYPFVTSRALEQLFGGVTPLTAAGFDCSASASDGTWSGTGWELDHSISGESSDLAKELTAYVDWQMKADGSLVFTVSDKPATESGDRLSLTLTMHAEITERTDRKDDTPLETITNTASGYTKTVVEKAVTTKTAVITWTPDGIRKTGAEVSG